MDSKNKHSKKLEMLLDLKYYENKEEIVEFGGEKITKTSTVKKIEELKIQDKIYKFNYYYFDLIHISFNNNERKNIFESIEPKELVGGFSNNKELIDFDIVIYDQQQQERADALPQNMTSIRMHLEQDYRKSFYVRPKLDNQTVSLDSNNSDILFESGTCVVCFQENIPIFRHYSCQHTMCTSCNNIWSATEVMTNCNRCPECRSE